MHCVRIRALAYLCCAGRSARRAGQQASRSMKPSRWRSSTTTTCWRRGLRFSRAKRTRNTANLRPNPSLFADWEYLPLGSPAKQNPAVYGGQSTADYLHNNTEGDIGLSYLIERGKKRQHRLQAAKDLTAQTRSLVTDNERTLTFNVASLFVDVSSPNPRLNWLRKISRASARRSNSESCAIPKARSARTTISKSTCNSCSLRRTISRPNWPRSRRFLICDNCSATNPSLPEYDVAGVFDYQAIQGNLEDFQLKALQNRPDLRAAQQGVTAARSQYEVQKTIAKPDVTVQANYSHVNAINAVTLYGSIPLPIFNRNQGQIEHTRIAITQAQEQEKATNGQTLTEVRDAYEALRVSDRVIQFYKSSYLDVAQKDRDIAEYAYQRGAVSLLDFLDAERNYRATQLAYRQALASYLVAAEQLRQAVGTRNL